MRNSKTIVKQEANTLNKCTQEFVVTVQKFWHFFLYFTCFLEIIHSL